MGIGQKGQIIGAIVGDRHEGLFCRKKGVFSCLWVDWECSGMGSGFAFNSTACNQFECSCHEFV